MSNKNKLGIFIVLFDLALLFTFFIAHKNIAIFNPKGIVALKERNLIIVAVSLMAIVLVPMVLLAYIFAWRYREGRGHAYEPEGDKSLKGGLLWGVLPFIVVCSLIFIVWKGAHELDPYRPIDPGIKPMTIQVVSLDWKWLFIYPVQNIATVNFIEFPEKTPIHFELTSDGPMNSFWIPQLGGQIYSMAGMSTQLHLMADAPGEYSGSTVEINGKGYAGMKFTAKSVTLSDFNLWIEAVKESPSKLTLEEYKKLAKPSENNPKVFYSSVDSNLYNEIIMKYMAPPLISPSPYLMQGHM